MSHARTGFPVSRRGSLLGIVLGAHAFFTLGKRIASPGTQANSTLSRLKPNTAKAA